MIHLKFKRGVQAQRCYEKQLNPVFFMKLSRMNLLIAVNVLRLSEGYISRLELSLRSLIKVNSFASIPPKAFLQSF